MDGLVRDFTRAFIEKRRYMLFLEGLGNTLALSAMAIVFGVLIGLLITFLGMYQYGAVKNPKLRAFAQKLSKGVSYLYLDIIRGTPSFIQMLVMFFIIFNNSGLHKLFVGAIAFGVNSGAYVSEIIRAGILSIDKGQTEAGRSLGLSGFQTMSRIVIPQAVKNVLPALANEFIVLIKETAVAGYIAVVDITKAANIISANTYSVTMPLLGATAIYYVINKLLSQIFKAAERRMRLSDHR